MENEDKLTQVCVGKMKCLGTKVVDIEVIIERLTDDTFGVATPLRGEEYRIRPAVAKMLGKLDEDLQAGKPKALKLAGAYANDLPPGFELDGLTGGAPPPPSMKLTGDLAVGFLLFQQETDAASLVHKVRHNGCGYDLRELIAGFPFDGKEYEAACPRCERLVSFRAPDFRPPEPAS